MVSTTGTLYTPCLLYTSGGGDNPIINDFMIGYIEGAQYIEPDIKVAVSYAGTFVDSTKGKELGLEQMNQQGVDVGFQIASQTGIGVLDAAKDLSLIHIYIDYYLLHSLDKRTYALSQKLHAFEFVQKKLAGGTVRHIGFSFHDTADVLEDILKAHPEMEYVQLQLNYLDWEDGAVQARQCYAAVSYTHLRWACR